MRHEKARREAQDARVSRSPRGEPTCHREPAFEVDGILGSLAYRIVSKRELSLRDSREGERTARGATPRRPPSGGWRTRRGSHRLPRRSDVRRSVSTCVVHRCEDPGGLERVGGIWCGGQEGWKGRRYGGTEKEGWRAALSVSAHSVVYCTRKKDKVEERRRKEEAGRTTVR